MSEKLLTTSFSIVVLGSHHTPQLLRLLTEASLPEDNKSYRELLQPQLFRLLSELCANTQLTISLKAYATFNLSKQRGGSGLNVLAKHSRAFLKQVAEMSKTTRHGYIWKTLFWIIVFSELKFPIIHKPLSVFPPLGLHVQRGTKQLKGGWAQLVQLLVALTS